MKSTFLASLVAAVALAKPHWSNLNQYTFKEFVAEHGLPLEHGTKEYGIRNEIFEKELERVIQHNQSNATWKETINHMSHLTASEKRAFLGRTKPKHDKLSSQK